MPVHDWTRVSAGTFHAFHLAWIGELQRVLNSILPDDYYALAEQVAGEIVPNVLTLQERGPTPPQAQSTGVPEPNTAGTAGAPAVALADAPPHVSVTDTISEAMLLAQRRRRLAIRHTTGDRLVALIEIVSPGNKEGRGVLDDLLNKAAEALDQGMHLLMVDLFPPGRFDPAGLHGALWGRLGGTFDAPPGRPLTLAAYRAWGRGGPFTAYVEPLAVGATLPDMPLFLDPDHYVPAPLEATYQGAWEGMPRPFRRVLQPNENGQSRIMCHGSLLPEVADVVVIGEG